MKDAKKVMNSIDRFTITLGIQISERHDASGFRNTLNLRNELYELKEDLCKYLRIKFDEFWNEINTIAQTELDVFRFIDDQKTLYCRR